MRQYGGLFLWLAAVLTAVLLQGCFTGIESTPKITASDVRHQRVSAPSAEEAVGRDIVPLPPKKWAKGHRWHVADDKFGMLLLPASENVPEKLAGTVIALVDTLHRPSVDGNGQVILRLTADGNQSSVLLYPTGITPAAFETTPRLDIPFAIDMETVGRARAVISTLPSPVYVISPIWYAVNDSVRSCPVLRHIPVEIDSVGPGNANFPVAVYFHATGRYAVPPYQGTKMAYMTLGTGRTSTRNFNTLFTFDDPRTKYPDITDPEVWDNIVHGKVRRGMTRLECRLAMGTPTDLRRIPTTAGTAEHWSYSDGNFLLFNEEGTLERYKL